MNPLTSGTVKDRMSLHSEHRKAHSMSRPPAVVVAALFALTACTPQSAAPILPPVSNAATAAGSTGAASPVASFTTWSGKDGQGIPSYFIFSADGTCRFGNLALPQGTPCTYRTYGDAVTVNAGGSETFTIQGDTMTGRGLTWQKVPNGSLTWVVGDLCAGVPVTAPVTVTSWPTASSIQAGQGSEESVLSGGQASAPGMFRFAGYRAFGVPGTFTVDVEFQPTCGMKVAGKVTITVTAPVPRVVSWPTVVPVLTIGDQLQRNLLTPGVVYVGSQQNSRAGQWSFTNPSVLKVAGKVKVAVQFDDIELGPIVKGEIEIQVNHVVIKQWPDISVWLGQPLSGFGYSGDEENTPGRGTFTLEPASFVPKAKGPCKATLVFTENYTGFRQTKAVTVTVR